MWVDRLFDLVVVGHLTIDLMVLGEEQRYELGGPPAYSMVAFSLGFTKVGLVSVIGKDFPDLFYEKLVNAGLDLSGVHQSATTTHFINQYTVDGQRTQKVGSLAEPIKISDIPSNFWKTEWMHISPVLNEVESAIITKAKNRGLKTSVDIQGFVRKRISGSDPQISKCEWKAFPKVASSIDVLKADIDEICHLTGQSDVYQAVKTANALGCSLILVTNGQHGSFLFHENDLYEIPALSPQIIVDHTGSGDVFIISFVVEYQRTKRPLWSAFFASSCASFNVETPGPTNFPSHQEVSNRLREYLSRSKNRQHVEALLDEPGPFDCPLKSD